MKNKEVHQEVKNKFGRGPSGWKLRDEKFSRRIYQALPEDFIGKPSLPILQADPSLVGEPEDDYSERREAQQGLIKEVYRHLTKKEREVFNLLAAGLDQVGVAGRLKITPAMVTKYKKKIAKKFKEG